MANERMFFCHAPSGHYVPLASRFGWGWGMDDRRQSERMQKLFDMVESGEAEGDQDDFCICLSGDARLKTNVTLD